MKSYMGVIGMLRGEVSAPQTYIRVAECALLSKDSNQSMARQERRKTRNGERKRRRAGYTMLVKSAGLTVYAKI